MNQIIQNNLAAIQQRIADAASKSGRDPDDVVLIGVTKYVDAQLTRDLFEAGCLAMGESRPQQLWDKAEQLQGLDIQWHMIGHLQRNKVKRTLPCVALVHSADSLRLIKAIDEASGEMNRRMPILLEVNVSGESAKHGFSAEELPQVLDKVGLLDNVRVCGLMAMAGLEGSLDDARREFAKLRDLRDELESRGTPRDFVLDELSMGMSGDFEVAIEEGATLIRVGSALFEGCLD